jgi:precorrin-6B methylase 2
LPSAVLPLCFGARVGGKAEHDAMKRSTLLLCLGLVAVGLAVAAAVYFIRASRIVTVRVYLPQEDAMLFIDGEEILGQGIERSHPIARRDAPIVVSAVWRPTLKRYNKITRKKEVVLPSRGEVIVDLREPNVDDEIRPVFVATPPEVAQAMCKLARVGRDDVVYDLGCGDAVMLITAVKQFGARRGVGVDIDPKMIDKATRKATQAGIADKVEIRLGDALKVEDLADADVVLLFMGEDFNERLKPILKKTLKPGARVVSHNFKMGDWTPDKTETVHHEAGWSRDIHLWVIKAGGAK